jgi:saccharopine dehydrogenase-like NADP-dependent oxidoreductase
MGVHMVSTSYISAPMRELNPLATNSGLTILNEMGLDPGIDHLEAKRVIEMVHSKGGKVLTYFCVEIQLLIR